MSNRNAYEMVADLVRGGGGAVGGVGTAGAAIGGFLYSETVGTVSCALSLIRIESS